MRGTTGIQWRTAVVAMGLAWAAPGCMVGPDYVAPPAPVAEKYRDPGSDAIKRDPADLTDWWKVLGDPTLNDLVQAACRQSPTLQSAAVRVLEAQARRGIAVGLLFPQDQAAIGGYTRNRLSEHVANFPRGTKGSFNDWQLGASAAWELDIWGRFRRGIESADAEVLAAVATYDDVLVSLIGNVATEYVSIRILQERLAVTKTNVEIQKRGLEIADTRFKGGTATDLDRMQATTLLRDTESFIPDIEAGIIQGQNRLCVLLGMPPKDLSATLADKPIPGAPAAVAVGIPADLLRRRPDVRRAERQLAAQCARIGIAKSDLYPSFTLVGDVRWDSEKFGHLFSSNSVVAFVGPTFRSALFNYGRIENNVRAEDAQFQAQIGLYEDTVLLAQAEVENAIAGYLGAQRQIGLLNDSVAAAKRAVEVAETQYRGGTADYTRVLNTQQAQQQEQERLVSVRGAVALNLVSLYRALGGGWNPKDNRIEIDPKIREQMRQRTDWDGMLPASQPSK